MKCGGARCQRRRDSSPGGPGPVRSDPALSWAQAGYTRLATPLTATTHYKCYRKCLNACHASDIQGIWARKPRSNEHVTINRSKTIITEKMYFWDSI